MTHEDRYVHAPGRDELMAEAGCLISGDRRDTYGDARADFTRTGRMWAAILGVPEVTAEQFALCMMAVKMGRLCHTPTHRDSWVDIIGYAALGGEIATTDIDPLEPRTAAGWCRNDTVREH